MDPAAAAAAFESAYRAAELYAAYEVVHERAVRPFRTADDGTLFGAARWAGVGVGAHKGRGRAGGEHLGPALECESWYWALQAVCQQARHRTARWN